MPKGIHHIGDAKSFLTFSGKAMSKRTSDEPLEGLPGQGRTDESTVTFANDHFELFNRDSQHHGLGVQLYSQPDEADREWEELVRGKYEPQLLKIFQISLRTHIASKKEESHLSKLST